MPADGGALKVHFLDVGQGDCTFVVPPAGEGNPVLFDCADAYVAERFTSNHDIHDLAAVVVSHLDIDHLRGVLPFLRQHFAAGRRVERLVLGLDRVPQPDADKNIRALVEQSLKWEKSPPHEGFNLEPPFRTSAPLELAKGDDWSIELVLPWYGTVTGALLVGGKEPNLCSAVLRVQRRDVAILIGGDAPLGSWEHLDEGLRAARVIRVPHHGGEIREHGREWREFSDLYDAVGAEIGVISVGTNNRYGHPKAEHVAAIRREGVCRLLCTQLTARCHDDPLALREQALDHAALVEWPYRHVAEAGHPSRRPPKEVPCTGSIVVALGAGGSIHIEPEPDGAHDTFLLGVEDAMCEARP